MKKIIEASSGIFKIAGLRIVEEEKPGGFKEYTIEKINKEYECVMTIWCVNIRQARKIYNMLQKAIGMRVWCDGEGYKYEDDDDEN